MNNIIKKFNIWLFLIVFLASILRLYDLTNYPSGFNADEAAIGYNAYSLIQTGKDEYGTSWPLSFKSFGDYKPGLYMYIVIPFIELLGLNELAVRLPSALFGIGFVLLIYYLALEIFKNRQIEILSSLIVAISPWTIHFSRGGWETNVATFFITLGSLFLIKSLNKKIYLFWGFLAFLMSMYLYQSPRLIIPIYLVILLILYKSDLGLNSLNNIKSILNKNYKLLSIYLVIFIILCIPLMAQFTNGTGQARFSGISILGDAGPKNRINELRGEHSDLSSKAAQLLHNKFTGYGPVLLGDYLDHFTPNFLFINGDEVARLKVPEVGQFFLVESIFFIFGLVALINYKSSQKKLVLALLLCAPLASSITFQTPSAIRSFLMVTPLSLIMGLGLWGLIKLVPIRMKFFMSLIVVIVLTFELTHYLVSYYILYPKVSIAWEYGFKQMIPKLELYQNNFNKVVITDRYDQPYILVLFFEQYDPAKYQPQAKLTERDKFNFGTVREFDKYEFHSVTKEEINSSKDTLFIVSSNEIPLDAKVLDQVLDSNGKPIFTFISS